MSLYNELEEASIDYQLEKHPLPIDFGDGTDDIARQMNVNDDFIEGGKWLFDHQWRSLKEEKPEKMEPIVMFSKPIGALMFGIYNGRFFYNAFNERIYDRITHWMRVPRPPLKELDSAE